MRLKPKNLADAFAKRALRSPAVRARVLRSAAARRRALVLLYHRVGPELRTRDRIVPTMSTDLFRRQLDAIRTIGTIVPMADLVAQVGDGARAEGADRRRRHLPRLAISFDDDDARYVDCVLPVLREQGVPATFFLSGRSLAGRGAYWWELLESVVATKGLSYAAKRLGLASTNLAELAGLCEEPAVAERVHVAFHEYDRQDRMSQEHIAELASAGMEIGFHTIAHPLLVGMPSSAVDDALASGRAEVEEAAGRPVRFFAYPYGKADAAVVERTRAAGYEAAFTNRGFPIQPGADPFRLGRFDTGLRKPDALVTALALRLAWPVA